MKGQITDIEGIRVGHCTDLQAVTGCTVLLCDEGAVGGVDIRGSASGTRELDPLYPLHLVERIHGLLLAGGSAFGLDAAGGVMEYLEERGVGFDVGVTRVPIIPAAILFDLRVGDFRVRPDRTMGYRACQAATSEVIEEGSVGAGTGATVGKLMGIECAMKGGVGTSSLELANGVAVGALVVVNAFGDVIEPETGQILAGPRDGPKGTNLLDTAAQMRAGVRPWGYSRESTTLVAVATNAMLSRVEATKLAQQAQLGLARTIRPVHTTLDGDAIFVLATGHTEGDLNALGVVAAEAVAQAVVRAIKLATPLGGIPSFADISSMKS
ncbi:MAG: P1 family peptidase [Candidatus Methylomirabilis oxyfera]|nr:P1 family peptidase [Candidatus Methylomirabilis oxyfera]